MEAGPENQWRTFAVHLYNPDIFCSCCCDLSFPRDSLVCSKWQLVLIQPFWVTPSEFIPSLRLPYASLNTIIFMKKKSNKFEENFSNLPNFHPTYIGYLNQRRFCCLCHNKMPSMLWLHKAQRFSFFWWMGRTMSTIQIRDTTTLLAA